MDIGKGSGGVSGRLSNFTPRRFVFDGVNCNSIEGVLQSFKFKNPEMQKEVCKLVGSAAKFKGKKKIGENHKYYIGKVKNLKEIV